MVKREILLLGNARLYEKSLPVQKEELEAIKALVSDLHDTLIDFRNTYGVGRAIAAPQIGVQKRVIYMFIDKPVVLINPVLSFEDQELMEVLDDCMSFPNLLVNVMRHKRCTIQYRDFNWQQHTLKLEGDLAELLQHEYDHLDGILATMRAINSKSYFIKNRTVE